MKRGVALIGFGYGAYLLYAYATGALYFYIHPIYIVPTVATGLTLVALAVLVWPGRTGHSHASARWAIAILALPVMLGFLVPPQPLSLSAAAQRGVELGSAGTVEAPAEFAPGRRPEAYTIKDWVKALQIDPEPGRQAGKPVRVTGFVYRGDRLPSGWFLISRFVLKCCAVDAQPVGLPVRAVDGRVPEAGRWVSVEGTWTVAEVDGVRRAVIAPSAVAPVERPDQPYLY